MLAIESGSMTKWAPLMKRLERDLALARLKWLTSFRYLFLVNSHQAIPNELLSRGTVRF